MKGISLMAILCVLVMVLASSGVTAAPVNHNFGTGVTELWIDSVNATCPSINNWEYSLNEQQHPYLDVEITCQFEDHVNDAINFTINFILVIEVWQESPPQFVSMYGGDDWKITNDNSSFYNNFPFVYEDTLSKEICWLPPAANRMYKCELTVYINNYREDISDDESDSWYITCVD